MTPETESQIFEKLKELESRIEKLDARIVKLENRSTTRKHPFEHSPYFDRHEFKKKFPDWPVEKLRHYYQEALDYSQGNGGRYCDWSAAIRKWARKDEEQGRVWGKTEPDYTPQ